MRLNLHLRGIDLLDVEVHAGRFSVAVFQLREDDTADAPVLTASGGGQFEHAGQQDEPDTAVMGFTNRQGVVH